MYENYMIALPWLRFMKFAFQSGKIIEIDVKQKNQGLTKTQQYSKHSTFFYSKPKLDKATKYFKLSL